MRFLDTLKLSLHSIFHNKARTLITVIIVFVVSLLIMLISILGLSFYTSLETTFINMYDESGTTFSLNNQWISSSDGTYKLRGITREEYEIFVEEFSAYPELMDNISISGNMVQANYIHDFEDVPASQQQKKIKENLWNFQYPQYDTQVFSPLGDLDTNSKAISYLKDGRLWTPEDAGQKYIWVSQSFIANALLYGDRYLSIGDSVVISILYWKYENSNHKEVFKFEKFKIAGIFLDSALKELNIMANLFLDLDTAYEIFGDDYYIDNITIIHEPRIGYNFNEEYKKMSAITDSLNERIEPSMYQSQPQLRFSCNLVDNLKEARIVGLVMTGAAVFICFFILLVSIGSVANSIIISIDKNKRFLGVMMAVGLNKRGVKRIIEFESLFIITLATGLAYGVLLALKPYFATILKGLQFSEILDIVIVMPAYIPIATILGFILMALLFARKSLAKITNMDAISVISEVA